MPNKPSLIIAIGGLSGSGKTSFVKTLLSLLDPKVTNRIPLDNYYKDQSHLSVEARKSVNFDLPDVFDSGLLQKHMEEYRAGREISHPVYDFKTHTRMGSAEIRNKPVLLVDGIFSLYFDEIVNFFDLKILIELSPELCFIRRLQRDMSERGRNLDESIEQYLKTVYPTQQQLYSRLKERADISVSNQVDHGQAAKLVFCYIQQYLEQRGLS